MIRTVRREDGVEFVTTHRLGSGLLAVVYAATNSDGEQVAVKVPAPHLRSDQFHRFEEEHVLLTRLPRLSVPQAWWGQDTETGGQVLLLEMAPETKLDDHLRNLTGLDKERVGLQAAVQYISLLQALHQLPRLDNGVGYTCADRKLGDLRWDIARSRLVVLDWNAVRPKHEGGIQEDIYTFASLWYQLLTSRYAREDLPLLDGTVWANDQVSIGMRAILLRALSSDPQICYQDTNTLFIDIKAWLVAHQEEGQVLYDNGSDNLSRATEAERVAQNEHHMLQQRDYTADIKIPGLQFDAENEALKYLDLAYRKEYREAYSKYEAALKLVQRQGDRLIDQVALAFAVSQYTLAEQSLAWANHTLEQVKRLTSTTPSLQLQVKRWELMLHIGDVAVDQTRVSLRDYRQQLTEALHLLQQGEEIEQADIWRGEDIWQRSETAITRITRELNYRYPGNPITSLLNWYTAEAHCRILLIKAHKDETSSDYQQAETRIQEAIQLLTIDQEIDTPIQHYITALHAQLKLEEQQRRLRYKADVASIVSQVKINLSEARKTLHTYLPYLLQLPVPATKLVEVMQAFTIYQQQCHKDAHRFFAGDQVLLEELKDDSNFLSATLLWRLQYELSTQQWLEMADSLIELLDKHGQDQLVRETVAEFLHQAISQMHKLVNAQKDDKAVLTIVQALQDVRTKLVNSHFGYTHGSLA